LPVKEPGVVEHGGRRANRRDPAAGGVMLQNDFAYARIGAQIFTPARQAGRSGRKRGCGPTRVARRRGGDAAAAGCVTVFIERSGGHVHLGTTQQIDGRERFNFFETIGENHEYARHEMKG